MMYYAFLLILLIVIYLRYKYTYWKRHNVVQGDISYLYGTILQIKSMNLRELFDEIYFKYKSKTKYLGSYIFLSPILVVWDLDLLKSILIKDFQYFEDRTLQDNNDERDPISKHLGRINGEEWRNLRHKLTATFTSGKMKRLFPLILEVAENLKKTIDQELNVGNVLDMYEVCGRFTIDIIVSCVFGMECNSLDDKNNFFRKMASKMVSQKEFNVTWRLFCATYMNIMKYFGQQRFSPEINDFILRLVRETIKMREEKNIKRDDFINMFIEMRNKLDENGNPLITIEQIAAQTFAFFLAGFETSSSAMSYTLYELSKNPEIQTKLRQHILKVLEKHNGVLTYEAIMEMDYLDQVLSETLRKYPALAAITRVAVKDYKIPDTNTIIPKGTKVFVPIYNIHYDPYIYENPEEFRTERFTDEEIKKRHQLSFLSFGEGPRNCIGKSFGRLQSRIGLITLLKNFEFSICKATPKTINYSKYNQILASTESIKLSVKKL